jgi:hypothetical protein
LEILSFSVLDTLSFMFWRLSFCTSLSNLSWILHLFCFSNSSCLFRRLCPFLSGTQPLLSWNFCLCPVCFEDSVPVCPVDFILFRSE